MKRLIPLAAIEVFVWLALVVCIGIISKVAFELTLGNATLAEKVATQTARVILSATAVMLWLVSWKKLTNRYFWRTIARRKTT